MKNKITEKEYKLLNEAYNFFNTSLFEGELPECLITLQRKGKCAGYFSGNRFSDRNDEGITIDEIALNPDCFHLPDIEIYQTLVHEMGHCWQKSYGKSSRAGYHNREWANKMEDIGLMPSSTGSPGGKKTGQKMMDYVICGGNFDIESAKFIKENGCVSFGSRKIVKEKVANKQQSKIKYTCSCGKKVFGKPGLSIICGDCDGHYEEN